MKHCQGSSIYKMEKLLEMTVTIAGIKFVFFVLTEIILAK